MSPALLHASYCLAHAPDLVQHGSKPSREIERQPNKLADLQAALRSYEQALSYPPNQVFIGRRTPLELSDWETPWTEHPDPRAGENGPFGWMVPQEALYGLMKACDDFELVSLEANLAERAREAIEGLPIPAARKALVKGIAAEELGVLAEREHGLPLMEGGRLVGFIRRAHPRDDTLKASVLLENLACKATAVLALAHAVEFGPVPADRIGFLLNSGEEAVGDRYQRGAGSLSKAVGEVVGCRTASGVDVKAFCASPVHSLILAASLVQAGVHEYVVVLGGGSLAKLGMKFLGHLKAGVPIMEDGLASMALVVGPSNGQDPEIRLDTVGLHPIGAGTSPKAIYGALVLEPLDRHGWNLTDIDRYAVELHNPEITLPAGSGNVPLTNYRTLGALAALRGEIGRDELDDFVSNHGLPGFSPTQGHIPAGVPYLGHARRQMLANGLRRVMIVAKGSLFLGRMTQLVDGVSFVLEKPSSGGGD